jgi:hypothetical protein
LGKIDEGTFQCKFYDERRKNGNRRSCSVFPEFIETDHFAGTEIEQDNQRDVNRPEIGGQT